LNPVQPAALSAVHCTRFAPWNRSSAVNVQVDMLDEWLAQHDGVITRAQAAMCGLSGDAVDRSVRAGAWRTIHRGVYFVVDRPFTADARIRCVVWGAGPNAVLQRGSRGLLAPGDNRGTEHHRSHDPTQGAQPRRGMPTPPPRYPQQGRRGLQVTSLELTVLEASIGKAHIMDRALQRHTDLGRLQRAHARNPGRTGAPEAKRLLKVAANGARSEGERLLIGEFRARKISGWVVNYRWGEYELDIAFLAEMLAIEIDGWAFHSDHDAFERDRSRQNGISPSWTILRYTWADLTERMDHVIAEITETLDRIRCSQPR
jgi:very-short-patch-repair endonuclease